MRMDLQIIKHLQLKLKSNNLIIVLRVILLKTLESLKIYCLEYLFN